MEIEYEATFPDIDKEKIREKLKKIDANLIKKEFLQKRFAFNLPNENKNAWLRVRDESDKITMSLKIVDGNKIENQKEICLKVDNFESAVKFLENVGCKKKAYQESKRELWKLNNVEITIDEWPFLEPFVEIEGKSESEVKNISEKIGFDYNKALFCAVDTLYHIKYKISEEIINNQTPLIAFDAKNPFIKN
ncbi:MAG TPA: CYTH domain-containing protein [Candidatus Nanoarchaeia archaeon]|nr:CYTH domain-containing protein [Candidatus Nanoarchaeia archaeon]